MRFLDIYDCVYMGKNLIKSRVFKVLNIDYIIANTNHLSSTPITHIKKGIHIKRQAFLPVF